MIAARPLVGQRRGPGAGRRAGDRQETDDAYTVDLDLSGVARDDVSAQLHDGVLTVHVPESARTKPRRIAISS